MVLKNEGWKREGDPFGLMMMSWSITEDEIEKFLWTINIDKPCEIDNMGGSFSANLIAKTMSLCFDECVYPAL